MTKYCFYVGTSFTLNLQPGLNGALFCHCDCCKIQQILKFVRNDKKSGSGRRIKLPKSLIVN